MARLRQAWTALSLAARFALASAAILFVGAVVLGTWVGYLVDASVMRRVAAESALYIEALVGPHVQALADGGRLDDQHREALVDVLERSDVGRRVVAIKIWRPDGEIVLATERELVGRTFMSPALSAAAAGNVVGERSPLDEDENVMERGLASELLETYVPIRRGQSERVVAVAEFYQRTDALDAEIAEARRSTWTVIAIATVAMYLLLAGIVRAGSLTIERQRAALHATVDELSRTASRLRAVSAERTVTEEGVLRRVAGELHDGIVQDLSAALLARPPDGLGSRARAAVESALREVRSLARGLALPDVAPLGLSEVVEQACADHERKTGRVVARTIAAFDAGVSTTLKIGVYRILQEALSNSFRHAPGSRVTVTAGHLSDRIALACEDDGPGIRDDAPPGLGLRGIRERAELLGGSARVFRRPGGGTTVSCELPLG